MRCTMEAECYFKKIAYTYKGLHFECWFIVAFPETDVELQCLIFNSQCFYTCEKQVGRVPWSRQKAYEILEKKVPSFFKYLELSRLRNGIPHLHFFCGDSKLHGGDGSVFITLYLDSTAFNGSAVLVLNCCSCASGVCRVMT